MALDTLLALRRLLDLFFSLAAGACVYLILLNRYLIHMREGPYKLPIIRGSMIAIGLGSLAFGWWAAGTAWLLAPVLVLLAVLAGELRRLVIRRRCRGEPPVETINVGVSLSKPETTTDLAVLRYELSVPGWHGPDLRVIHISDLHVNSHIGVRYYRAVLARAAELCPDLLIYTGDFVTHVEHAALLSDVLTAAHGRLATLAVLGNHDYWAGAAHVAEAVRSAGIILLGNGYVRIPTSRRLRSPNLVRASTVTEGEHLLVCGYEGPWSSAPWQPPQIAPGELALMMTHTPDNIYRLSRLGFTVVFAGHYHAGQMRIPWLGSLVVPSLYGRRFDHGHFVVNGTHLFVTAGVGTAIPPRRIYCQPDIFVVDIRRGQAVSAEPVAAAYAASDAQAPAAKGPGRSVPPSPPGGPHA